MGKICFWTFIVITMLISNNDAEYLAFSLKNAEKSFIQGRENDNVQSLGGITYLLGIAFDKENDDIILFGKNDPKVEKLSLSNFVIALRAILKFNTLPLVSIDQTAETKKTGKQYVRFGGEIQNTAFGNTLFEADVLLKKIGLSKINATIWGVESYFDLSAQRWKSTGNEDSVLSRFWFKPVREKSSVALSKGIAIVKELSIGVKTEVMNTQGSSQSSTIDDLGERFALTMSESFHDLKNDYKELASLDPLFRMTSLAEAINKWQESQQFHIKSLNYWLNDYKVPYQNTPVEYPLLTSEEGMMVDGKKKSMTIQGGIELEAMVLELQDGSIIAIRDIIMKSRPNRDNISWVVPIEDSWDIKNPTSISGTFSETLAKHPRFRETGTFFSKSFNGKTHDIPSETKWNAPLDTVNYANSLTPQIYSPNVGGVMLSNIATVKGSQGIDLTGGNFALIVDGERAQLDPKSFRKFITALWAIYYSNSDPGISIDPIAPRIKKHMVRYIGRVVNSDLGRVMREADYLMKKWAVGTEQPDIPGYKSPDGFSATMGLSYVNASSRFWFVPEDMTFTRAGNALLFSHGRMRIKTEYISQNKNSKAEPSNEAFAKWFTDNYDEIAKKYPVFADLFEYSKYVALAKFLKESGVPLMWFLLANKDRIITEDSPGTVDELAKESDYWKNLYIKGGVDLKTEGQYVYDSEAIHAIHKALSDTSLMRGSQTSLVEDKAITQKVAQPFQFRYAKKNYSVLPQHSLTSGKDFEGICYQTDIALKISKLPGLELVRYFNPLKPGEGDFGNGWNLLIPYRVYPADAHKQDFLNVRLPVRMIVEDLLHAKKEILTFSTERYTIAGWVPDQIENSHVVGLFLMSNASLRLSDKIGNQFWFDPAGNLTDYIFSENYHTKIQYQYDQLIQDFILEPYEIEAADEKRVRFLNVMIPERMIVKNCIYGNTEILKFNDKGMIAGYIPEERKNGQFQILALMSNGGFQLLDKEKNEIVFTPSGRFRGIFLSSECNMLQSLQQGEHTIKFQYSIDPKGRVIIASATLYSEEESSKPIYSVQYIYDKEGRLCSAKALAKNE